MKKTINILLIILTIFITTRIEANIDHEQVDAEQHLSEHNDPLHDSHDDLEHNQENSSYINSDLAQHVGIVTTIAGSEELHQTSTIYGSLVSGPEQLSHVRARFEGLITSVYVTVGDSVKTGDVLAEIESNASLKAYQIRSPISGRVIERHANKGEVTVDQVLFSIANLDTVWAELRVYPLQQALIEEGQSVHIFTQGEYIKSEVRHVIPAIDSPYQLARVKLDNHKQILSPGLMIEAQVTIGHFPVSLAIKKSAVQNLEGRQGVFVKRDDEYIFKPLVLGREDDHLYEIINGLEHGEEYVIENSYLIKADIEKSGTEHQH